MLYEVITTGCHRSIYPREHLPQVAAVSAHLRKYRFINAVEAYRYPMQTGIGERLRDRRQQHTVGRQREIVDPRQCRQPRYQVRDLLVEERLAARYAELRHAEPDGDSYNFV